MSTTEIDRFFADMESDAALSAEVQKEIGIPAGTTIAPDASIDAVIDIASAHGYDFSVEELQAHAAEKGETGRALSDDELEAVSGGNFTWLVAGMYYLAQLNAAQRSAPHDNG